MRLAILIVLCFTFFSASKFNQAEEKETIIIAFRDYKLSSISEKDYANPTFENKMILWRIQFLKNFNIYNPYFDSIEKVNKNQVAKTTVLGSFLYEINLGDYYFYRFSDKLIEARNHYVSALEIAEKENSKILICEALRKILELNRSDYLFNNTTSKLYLKKYLESAFDETEKVYANYFKLILEFQYRDLDRWNHEKANEILAFANSSNNSYLNAIIYQLIASYFDEKKEEQKAIKFENTALKELRKITFPYNSTLLKRSKLAKARFFLPINVDSVTQILSSIDKTDYNRIEKEYSKYRFLYQSIADSIQSNYKGAYQNLINFTIALEEETYNRSENKYKELETKYQTTEKEKQILIEQQKKKQNQNIAIALGGGLFTVSVIGFLLYKNTKRKQRIAEQEKELEIQKKEKILKDQELLAIDAMIAGQEKERERLASDLHDSVGATLSAAKLQFDHLSKNKDKLESMEELFQKTGILLDEAYKEVRSMAHLKNSGVIAKKGLLPAISTFAKNASATGQLTIDVQDFGLDERLDPSMEITIFRIIQELVTNIIKHSEASEASISITQHKEMLSIIVEDNGKGFDPREIHSKEGLGLSNIEKRIEHFEGTLEVDSTINKGTSILIEIPI